MIIIAAMTEDRVIGSGPGMPWHVPEEYHQYLRFIEGQTVIIGRKSFEIFGDDLTCENTIVVSGSLQQTPNIHICVSFDDAVQRSSQFDKTVFIAGGASMYQRGIPLAERMYLSTIKGEFPGDTYFPEFDQHVWTVEKEEPHEAFVFRIYRRK